MKLDAARVLDLTMARSSLARRVFVRIAFALEKRGDEGSPCKPAFAAAFPSMHEKDIALLADRHLSARYSTIGEQRRLAGQSANALRKFVSNHCDVIGLEKVPEGPMILACPHYGFYALAALKLGEIFGDRIRIFFNPPERNPFSAAMTALFNKYGASGIPLMNDRRGVIGAVRHLQSGNVVGIMPDFATASASNAFVPFFGRFTQAMTGTAYFAQKSGAAIVPINCERIGRDRFAVVFHQPIDPPAPSHDPRDEIYSLTARLYARMEDIISSKPEEWMFWRDFEMLSVRSPIVPRTVAEATATLEEWAQLLSRAGDKLGDDFRKVTSIDSLVETRG
jgi:lauroyl/myristoyl acyltransferase